MSGKSIESWYKQRGLSPTKAAALFDISLSTLSTMVRGARVREETLKKVKSRMATYDEQNPEKLRAS